MVKLATVLFLHWSRCQEEVKKCILLSDVVVVILDPYRAYWFLLEGPFENMSLELLWNRTSCQPFGAQPYYNARYYVGKGQDMLATSL